MGVFDFLFGGKSNDVNSLKGVLANIAAHSKLDVDAIKKRGLSYMGREQELLLEAKADDEIFAECGFTLVDKINVVKKDPFYIKASGQLAQISSQVQELLGRMDGIIGRRREAEKMRPEVYNQFKRNILSSDLAKKIQNELKDAFVSATTSKSALQKAA